MARLFRLPVVDTLNTAEPYTQFAFAQTPVNKCEMPGNRHCETAMLRTVPAEVQPGCALNSTVFQETLASFFVVTNLVLTRLWRKLDRFEFVFRKWFVDSTDPAWQPRKRPR